MTTVTLKIRHKDQTQCLSIRKGLGLQAVAGRHETPIEFDCRAADCGICIVRVLEGADALSPPRVREKDFLAAMRADPEERLACQAQVMGNVTIEVDSYA